MSDQVYYMYIVIHNYIRKNNIWESFIKFIYYIRLCNRNKQ